MTQKEDSGDESPVLASDADDSDAENGDDEEEEILKILPVCIML